ncbi:hypothetical protein MAR_029686, partial [Mya arenaria]
MPNRRNDRHYKHFSYYKISVYCDMEISCLSQFKITTSSTVPGAGWKSHAGATMTPGTGPDTDNTYENKT